MFDEVVFVNAHSLNSPTTPILGLKFGSWHPLDVAVMGQSNHDVFFFDQVFVFKAEDFTDHQFRTPFIPEFFLDFKQFVINDFVDPFGMSQDITVVGNGCHNFPILVFNLFPFQSGQAHQPHVQDGLCLFTGKRVVVHQLVFSHFSRLGSADNGDDFVDVIQRNS